VDENRRLCGAFDRHDMDQILAQIAEIPQDQRRGLPRRKLTDFVPANPLCVTLYDSILTAAMTLLDHGKAWLPVVQSKDDFQPVGYVRGERIVNRMIENLANRPTDQTSAAKAG
jgi:hypothetical protein